MALSAYDQIFSNEILFKTWKKLYADAKPSSRDTVGSDGESINTFEAEESRRLRMLRNDLRSRQFSFEPLRAVLVPKSNGRDRLICVPTVKDRIVQRALADHISDKYRAKLANAISYGFIRKRNVHDAVRAAIAMRESNPWAFKTDITSFFDQIQREDVSRAIKREIRDSSLHQILMSATNCEIQPTTPGYARRIRALGIKPGLGVRQGMPLSPLFANLVLLNFDRKLIKSGYKAIRYADDLIFFCSSRAECEAISEHCKALLRDLKLTVPSLSEGSKSVIYAPNDAAEFLGLSLTLINNKYTLTLHATQRERIRQEILSLSSIEELLTRKLTLATVLPVVRAKVNGFLDAYSICADYDDLTRELHDLERKVLRRIYEDQLYIDLSRLNKKTHTFLGLGHS